MTAAERELTRALALLRLEVHGDIVDHIQVKAEEAIREAREDGEEAVRMERIRLTALWEDRIRMSLEQEREKCIRMLNARCPNGTAVCHCGYTVEAILRARAQESEG